MYSPVIKRGKAKSPMNGGSNGKNKGIFQLAATCDYWRVRWGQYTYTDRSGSTLKPQALARNAANVRNLTYVHWYRYHIFHHTQYHQQLFAIKRTSSIYVVNPDIFQTQVEDSWPKIRKWWFTECGCNMMITWCKPSTNSTTDSRRCTRRRGAQELSFLDERKPSLVIDLNHGN